MVTSNNTVTELKHTSADEAKTECLKTPGIDNEQTRPEEITDDKFQMDILKEGETVSEEARIKTALYLFLVILIIIMLFVLSRVSG